MVQFPGGTGNSSEHYCGVCVCDDILISFHCFLGGKPFFFIWFATIDTISEYKKLSYIVKWP